jgi:hypothetical protein
VCVNSRPRTPPKLKCGAITERFRAPDQATARQPHDTPVIEEAEGGSGVDSDEMPLIDDWRLAEYDLIASSFADLHDRMPARWTGNLIAVNGARGRHQLFDRFRWHHLRPVNTANARIFWLEA